MLYPLFLFGGFWFWVLLLLCTICVYWAIDRDSGWGVTATLIVSAVVLWLFGNVNIFGFVFHHPIWSLLGLIASFVIGFFYMCGRWEVFIRDRRSHVDDLKAEFHRAIPLPTVTFDTICIEDFASPKEAQKNPAAVFKDGSHPKVPAGMVLTAVETAQNTLEWENSRRTEVDNIYRRYNENLWNRLSSAGETEYGSDGKLTEKPYVRNHKAMLSMWMAYWPFCLGWFLLHDFVQRICTTAIQMAQRRLQERSDAVFANSHVNVSVPDGASK